MSLRIKDQGIAELPVKHRIGIAGVKEINRARGEGPVKSKHDVLVLFPLLGGGGLGLLKQAGLEQGGFLFFSILEADQQVAVAEDGGAVIEVGLAVRVTAGEFF